MSTSLLYHAFGIRGYHYTRTDYQDGQTIFTIRQEPETCRCSACGSPRLNQQGIHRLWRCESYRLCRSRRGCETVLPEEGPEGREDRHEGLAEPGPRQVGLQVPRRDPSEVPSQGVVRKDATRHRAHPAGVVPPEGYRTGGG